MNRFLVLAIALYLIRGASMAVEWERSVLFDIEHDEIDCPPPTFGEKALASVLWGPCWLVAWVVAHRRATER